MKKLILPVVIVLLTFLSVSCNFWGLTLTPEAENLVGLWRSSGWNYDDEYCYYDFRSDGRVFITEWTDDLEVTNNPIVPNSFYYNVNDGILKIYQFATIVQLEFELDDTAVEEGYCILTVEDWSSDYDFDNISYGYEFYLSRQQVYSREAEIVMSAYGEALDE